MSNPGKLSHLVRELVGGLTGCSEDVGTGGMAGPSVDHALQTGGDRLSRNDALRSDDVGELLSAREQQRRSLLKTGGMLGALAATAPLLAPARAGAAEPAPAPPLFAADGGRVHVVESTKETVHWGVFDSTLPNILEVDSGDVLVFPKTWSHFLNQLQPGLALADIVKLRLSHPGVGPHAIIGPVGVRGAEPGDVLEVQYLRLVPNDWGACFNNPGPVGTGALPDVFADGQVKYLAVDSVEGTAEFAPGITLPVSPFQGTLGVAPPDGLFPTPSGHPTGVVSSVPPGPHAGNVDCREAVEGTRVFIPVWKSGAKLFTGDSHALQGDGEVNLSALETGMKELRIRVVLHKRAGLSWPLHETPAAWIAHGMDKDLNLAFRRALLNAIEFLSRRAGLSQLDAYALCSLGVSFRVSQVVNGNKGVYALIPKSIFQPQLRRTMNVV